ncbi:MAG: gamma-glutamylcyclotransferase family protein [Promethearchaeota archaeon]
MNNLFVYGTLQQGQSRSSILKGLSYEKASILGFVRVQPPSLGFPFILEKKGSIVNGEVYFNLPDSLIAQIDLIEAEGELYHRIMVDVKAASGAQLSAFVYYPSDKLISSTMEKH